MALVDSNTYIEPTAGTSLNTARSQINNAIRSLLTTFRSSANPTTTNITASGAGIGEQDGMLFRMANNNVAALYISDSTHKKSSDVGGNFTRVGIGNRVENGIVAMMANVSHYEMGELAATVSNDGGTLEANARLYLCTGNAEGASAVGSTPDFRDVGIPPTNGSVVNTMIAIGGVTSDRMNFTFEDITSSPENRTNAHLKVGTSLATSNIAILLGSTNVTSNVSLVKLHATNGQAAKTGLNVFDQSTKYAPVAANLICQSTIQGTDTDVAPLMPAGSIIAWPTAAAPTGWQLCDGSAINRTTYAALFALISTTYGVGNGSSTFNVPDLGDRVIAGKGANNAIAAGGPKMFSNHITPTVSATPSATTGTSSVSVGSKDAGSATVISALTFAGHTHDVRLPTVIMNYIIKT